MALHVYREISVGSYEQVSVRDAGDSYLPVISTLDGVLGETAEVKLFVRSNNLLEYYTYITVKPESLTSPDDTIGTASGWGVKLRAGATQPTEAEWDAIDYSTEIDISNIGTVGGGDITTYSPFWYRVECPAGYPAMAKTNIVLVLSYTANAVGP